MQAPQEKWFLQPTQDLAAASNDTPAEDPVAELPADKLTTLGLLWLVKDPWFPWYFYKFCRVLKENLIHDWWFLHKGTGEVAAQKVLKIRRALELDMKAMREFLLLDQTGKVGRALSNEILWKLMTTVALDGEFRDMSNMTSGWVGGARTLVDIPPREHRDLHRWSWRGHVHLPIEKQRWHPDNAPGVAPSPGTWLPRTLLKEILCLLLSAGQIHDIMCGPWCRLDPGYFCWDRIQFLCRTCGCTWRSCCNTCS